jgi:hypothetical protein
LLSGKTSRKGAKARRKQKKNEWSSFPRLVLCHLSQKVLCALAPLREVFRYCPITMLKSPFLPYLVGLRCEKSQPTGAFCNRNKLQTGYCTVSRRITVVAVNWLVLPRNTGDGSQLTLLKGILTVTVTGCP